jgi:hypothetical protein
MSGWACWRRQFAYGVKVARLNRTGFVGGSKP